MNIAIIGQNCIFRDSLRLLLNQVADFTVVFDSDDIPELQDYPEASSIDVVLFDCCYGNEDFSSLINKINKLSPNIKILIMTDSFWQYYWLNQKKYSIEGIILRDSGKLEFEKEIKSLIKPNWDLV